MIDLDNQKDNTIFAYELWAKVACPYCGKITKDSYGPVDFAIDKDETLKDRCNHCQKEFKIKVLVDVSAL